MTEKAYFDKDPALWTLEDYERNLRTPWWKNATGLEEKRVMDEVRRIPAALVREHAEKHGLLLKEPEEWCFADIDRVLNEIHQRQRFYYYARAFQISRVPVPMAARYYLKRRYIRWTKPFWLTLDKLFPQLKAIPQEQIGFDFLYPRMRESYDLLCSMDEAVQWKIIDGYNPIGPDRKWEAL